LKGEEKGSHVTWTDAFPSEVATPCCALLLLLLLLFYKKKTAGNSTPDSIDNTNHDSDEIYLYIQSLSLWLMIASIMRFRVPVAPFPQKSFHSRFYPFKSFWPIMEISLCDELLKGRKKKHLHFSLRLFFFLKCHLS
jgi:hypothetical protein